MKKRSNIFIGVCIVLLIVVVGGLVFNRINRKGEFIELTYSDVMKKIDNKEDLVLCISRTTCSHCESFKPKLEKVAKEYGINLYYIDIDKYSDKEQKEFEGIINYGGSTPTTVFLRDGEESTTSNRINGDASSDRIISKLRSNEFIK